MPALLGAMAVAGLVGARIAAPDPFERMRTALSDAAERAAPRIRDAGASPVRIVDIDDASLARLGQWPWPRATVARMVAALQDLGAAAIALDMVFSEPDRTSPANLAAGWLAEHGRPLDTGGPLPDYDRTFADTIARGRVVLGYGLLPADNGARRIATPAIATIGSDPRATIPAFAGAVPNLAILDAVAAGHGSFAIAAGRDEIVRRLPLIAVQGGDLVPGLAVEALRVAQGEDALALRTETAQDGTVTGYHLRIGALDVPLDAQGGYRLHHAGTLARGAIPAWRLLDPEVAAGLKQTIAGRIVLIGTSATGLSDLRPTPLNAFEPGVAIHAEAIEQIVSGIHPVRPAWATGAEIVAALGLALVLALVTAFASLRLAGALALLLPAAILAAAWLAFTRQHLLVDPGLPVMAMVAAFVATMLARHLLTERDAARLKAAFTHYLSPDLVQALARDPGRLKLGGETRPMTFLFTDLEGFTAMTESRGAEALVSLLNAYLDGLCGVAMAHGGTVDKIVGDAVHVMFNAPLDQPDHAERAVSCALAIDAFAVAFATGRRARGVPFGATRIGVNTGPAVVGNFGGARRFDYTAHGDAINTAARLEAANKALGTRICVSGSTVSACPGLPFRPIGSLTLRGKANAVPVFDPLPADRAGDAFVRDYCAAFLRLDTEGDGAPIELLHAARPDDPVLALHARRLRAGERTTRIAA